MKKRNFKQLTFTNRLQLETMLKLKTPKRIIAETLGVHISTIYREIKRGTFEKKKSVWDCFGEKTFVYKKTYSPDIANEKYLQNLRAKGAPLKIDKDIEFANYIENRIVNDGLTPLAVLGEIKAKRLQFKTSISINTLYSYIYKGVFLRLSMKYLPLKKDFKPKQKKLVVRKAPRGLSIEQRPEEVKERNTFGHWEMDCVLGKREKSKVLLVLTERLSRKEIIMDMKDQTSSSVVHCLNILERNYGKLFPKIFRSITVDNGSEFSDYYGLEKSSYGKRKRTTVYYCHPYSSSERGTNERMNREIRRKFPKGIDFNRITSEEVKSVETWLNNYPRGILNYQTPNSVFNYYLSCL